MSIISVKQSVINKLSAMQTLKGVYGYETTNVAGKYPFATVTLAGGEGEFRSTAHNLRTREITIRIYQEQAEIGQGNENAETIVANVINELEQAFDMDTTLSGTCHYAIPVSWNADYVDREHDARILTVNLQAVELVTAN